MPLLEIVIGFALVGLVAGFLWEAVWTPPTQVVQKHAVYYADYESLRRVFTGTGLYVLISLVGSALSALVATLLTRRRELLTLAAILVGSTLAGFVMWRAGVSRGPADPLTIAAHAADGTQVKGPLQVSGSSPFLVWPMVSMLVVALVFFGWPRDGVRPRRRGEPEHSTDRDDPGMDDVSRG